MKVVILAGGLQSTISEDREGIPKPMVDIGGKPLLWHIMKHFSEYGLNEFILCGGYRVNLIKEYFMDFYIYESDITVDLQTNTVEVHKSKTEKWQVTVVDTGLYSSTGQRISKIREYITEEDFIVTYGDCLSDIKVDELIKTHQKSGKAATIAMAKPTGRNTLLPVGENGQLLFGRATEDVGRDAWVDANCFVFRRMVFDYLVGNYDLQKQLFLVLSEKKQLAAYPHSGFWMTLETRRDLVQAENLWNAGMAPWIKEHR